MKPCTVAAKIYNALFPFSDTNMKILAFTLRWEFISAWRLCTYSFSTLMKRQSTCHCSKKKEFLCSICTKMLWAFWMLPPLHIFATFCDKSNGMTLLFFLEICDLCGCALFFWHGGCPLLVMWVPYQKNHFFTVKWHIHMCKSCCFPVPRQHFGSLFLFSISLAV